MDAFEKQTGSQQATQNNTAANAFDATAAEMNLTRPGDITMEDFRATHKHKPIIISTAITVVLGALLLAFLKS